jgi:hypothetical protein
MKRIIFALFLSSLAMSCSTAARVAEFSAHAVQKAAEPYTVVYRGDSGGGAALRGDMIAAWSSGSGSVTLYKRIGYDASMLAPVWQPLWSQELSAGSTVAYAIRIKSELDPETQKFRLRTHLDPLSCSNAAKLVPDLLCPEVEGFAPKALAPDAGASAAPATITLD